MRFKTVFMAAVLLLMAAFPVWAEDSCVARTAQTESALIRTGDGKLCGIMLATDGTNAVTLNIYDNTAASGTKLIPTRVIPTSSTNRGWSVSFIPAIPFRTGLYVSVSTSGSVSYVPYTATR